MIKNMTNTPSSASEALTLGSRFHYWTGRGGKRYIFSVYQAGTCPPLPGAVYVIAKRGLDGNRFPLAIGRFPALWESASRQAAKLLKSSGGDEVHVHLLADDDQSAEEIVCDLKPAFGGAVRLRAVEDNSFEAPLDRNRGFSERQTASLRAGRIGTGDLGTDPRRPAASPVLPVWHPGCQPHACGQLSSAHIPDWHLTAPRPAE